MRNYRQRLCPDCGQPCPCHLAGRTCPMDSEMKAALSAFKRKNGWTWKAALRELWLQGKDEGALRRVRNSIGPRLLDKITPR